MKVDTATLAEVVDLKRSGVKPQEVDPETPYLGLENIGSDGRVDWSETADSSGVKSRKYVFTADHVLFGKLRPYLKKIARPDRGGICSTDIIPIRPGREVDRDYLFHFLRHPVTVELATVRSSGANLPRLSPTKLAEFNIPLPSLPAQKRISAVLDTADSLLAKRRASLDQLHVIVKSAFLKFFGDPVTNPKGWDVQPLVDLYESAETGTKCGPFGSALKKAELVEEGVPVWNMDNIGPGGRTLKPFRAWITPQKFEELRAYSVKDGDVIISRAGTVGKMCVARTGAFNSIISTNLIRVRFGNRITPEYFVYLMTFFGPRVGRLRTGPDGSFTHMNTKVLDGLSIPVPPREQLTAFSSFLSAYEAHRRRLTSHVAELEHLFASLRSRAFSGKL